MKLNKLFSVLLAGVLAISACVKTGPKYEPAPIPEGEQVYIPVTFSPTVDLSLGQTTFAVPVVRATDNLEAIEVPIIAEGDNVDLFSVPGTISFAEEQAETELVITVLNPDDLGIDKYFELVIKIGDEELTTVYGRPEIVLSVGYALPWIEFKSGVMIETEDYWGEAEPNKIVLYQQISETMRLCKVENCFGYETIKAGDEYDVQDYVWYWNTETNICYVLPFYIGYINSNGEVWASDYPSYVFTKNGWEEEEGFAIGSPEYFAWSGPWAKSYGYYHPYYDPDKGVFHLADTYIVINDGTILGYYIAQEGHDTFECDGFVRTDCTIDAEYTGMVVNTEGTEAKAVIKITPETEDPTSVLWVVTTQDVAATETLAAIIADPKTATATALSGEAVNVETKPLETGLYRFVAVPAMGEELQEADAIAIDFYFVGVSGGTIPEVDLTFEVGTVADFFGEDWAAEQGATDYNSMAFWLKGAEIKTIKTYVNTTYVIDEVTAAQDLTPEDLVLNYGSVLSDERIEKVNTTGLGSYYSPLDPETEWGMIVYAENVYGKTKVYYEKHTTGAEPTVETSLKLGTYTLYDPDPDGETQYDSVCDMTVGPISENVEDGFYVKNLGIDDGLRWHAEYDETANTLTVSGILVGSEDNGNMFGKIAWWFNQSEGTAYAYVVGTSKDDLVFSVDAETGELTAIDKRLVIGVYGASDGSYKGYYNYFNPATTTMTYNESATASVKSVKTRKLSTKRSVEGPYLWNGLKEFKGRDAASVEGLKIVKPVVKAVKVSDEGRQLTPCTKVKKSKKTELRQIESAVFSK